MEKDSFFQIMEDMCSYNLQNYFDDLNYYTESLASQVEIENQSLSGLTPQEIIQQRSDEYHQRKQKLFEKLSYSYYKNYTNSNQLSMIPSHPAEQFAYTPSIDWDSFDFLSHKDQIEKFYTMLKQKSLYEIFYQPQNENFIINCEKFIKDNLQSTPSTEEDKLALTNALNGYILLSFYQGRIIDIIRLYQGFKDNAFFKDYITNNSNEVKEFIIANLKELFLQENNFEIYPIMRNYSIKDAFNISKNILYTNYLSNESKPYSSIATDSKFLYVILFGVCGGLYKIGTGNKNTVKGKVYKSNIKLNSIETNPMLVYVKETNRLYLKTNQMEIGHVKIINPDTLTIENIKKLNFPEKFKDKNISEKNCNYILLSDESHLYAIGLEPENSTESKVNEPLKTGGKLFGLAAKSIGAKINSKPMLMNLVLYKFPMNSEKNELQIENESMINELYESFSTVFTKEKCKFALEKKNYNMEKAANFLIKNFNKDSESSTQNKIVTYEEIYYSERIVLYQSKTEMAPSLNGYYEISTMQSLKTQFDPVKFDLLKWVIIKDKLYAYKLKEGGCFVFGTNKESETTFKVTPRKVEEFSFGSKNKKTFPSNLKRDDNVFLYPFNDALQKDLEFLSEEQNVLNSNSRSNSNQQYPPIHFSFHPRNVPPFSVNSQSKEVKNEEDDYNQGNEFLPDLINSPHQPQFIKSFLKNIITSLEPKEKQQIQSQNSETFKGTLLTILHCLCSSTISSISDGICYDKENSCYYLIGVSILSLSVLVCDTHEHKFKSEKELISKCTKMDISEVLKNQKSLFENMKTILLYLNCYCWDMPWVYSNWNYFYSNLNLGNLINEEHIKYTIGEYPHKIFNYTSRDSYRDNLEVLDDKIEKSANDNQNGIIKIIETHLNTKIDINGNKECAVGTNTPNRAKKNVLSYIPTKNNNNLFNWNCRNDIYFDIKEGNVNENSKFSFYLENHKFIFGAICTDETNFSLVMNQDKHSLLYLLYVKYYIRNYKHYMPFKKGSADLIEIRTSLLNLYKESTDEEVKKIIIEILKEGYEIMFTNLKDQFDLFIMLYQMNEWEFFYKKFLCDSFISNILECNFNTICAIKTYSLSTVDKKNKNKIKISSKITKNSKNKFIYPFPLILLSSNIYLTSTTTLNINYQSLSNSFWEIVTKEIIQSKNEKMLTFLINLYIQCLNHISSTQNEIFITLFNKAYKLLAQLLCLADKDNSILQNILNFCHVVLYSYYSKCDTIEFKEISFFLQKNSFVFSKILSLINSKIKNKIEYLGFTNDNDEIILEYPLKHFSIPSQTIKYEEHSHIIVVDIQIIRNDSKSPEKNFPSKDIVIKSNYHLSNSKGLTWNNYRDFGTSFTFKESQHNDHAKFFLLGNEVTIASATSNVEYKIVSSSLAENKTANNGKVIIKIYPFGRPRYGRGNISIDDPLTEKMLALANDSDHISNDLYKKMINGNNTSVSSLGGYYDEYIKNFSKEEIAKFQNENVNNVSFKSIKMINVYANVLSSQSKDVMNSPSSQKGNYYNSPISSPRTVSSNINTYQSKEVSYKDIETNEFKLALKLIDKENKNISIKEFDEVKDIKISNLIGINKLNYFNENLWNMMKNMLYSCYVYHHKDDKKEEFMTSILNQVVMNMKREKTTFDNIRNYINDSISILDSDNDNDCIDRINNLITDDLHSLYFSNEDALNEICDVNGILPQQSISLESKLKILTSFFLSKVDSIINYNNISQYKKTPKKEIEMKIVQISPYVRIPLEIITKLVLLLSIDRVDNDEIIRKFIVDKNIYNVEEIKTLIVMKYKLSAIMKYGIEKFSDYYLQCVKLDQYDTLFNNSNGIFKNQIENEKLIDKISVICIEKAKMINHIVKNDLIKKSNLRFFIEKLSFISNDISKLFLCVNEAAKKETSSILLESIKLIFANKIYLISQFDIVITSITNLVSVLSRNNNDFSINLLKLFTSSLSTENSNLMFKIILSLIKVISIDNDEKANVTTDELISNIFTIVTKTKDEKSLVSLCKMTKIIIKNTNSQYKPCFDKLYKKIGELITSCDRNKNNDSYKAERYKIILNANSNELDYIFLVNVLFKFEDKYQTKISKLFRLNDIELKSKLKSISIEDIKGKSIIELTDMVIPPQETDSPLISVDIRTKIVTTQTSSSNAQKTVTTLKDILPIYSLNTLSKALAQSNPSISRLRSKNKKTFNIIKKVSTLLSKEYSKLDEKKDNEDDIKLRILQLKRILHHINDAELIAECAVNKGFAILSPSLTYEQAISFSKLVHQCLNYENGDIDPEITYSDIFPPFPKLEELIEGYTNVIKETTLNFANVTIIKENVFNSILEKNLDKIDLSSIISSEEFISGEKICVNIGYIVDLIYDIAKKKNEIIDCICSDIKRQLKENKDSDTLLGVLVLAAGMHHYIRNGKKVIYNDKTATVVNTFLSDSNQCEISYSDSSNKKIVVNKKDLIIVNKARQLIMNKIDINDVIEYMIKILKSNEKTIVFHYLLKLLSEYPKEIKSNELIELLQKEDKDISSSLSIEEAEMKFISALMKKYNKSNVKFSYDIFTPFYPTTNQPIKQINKISNQVLPESEYLSSLPQINFNKCFTCLFNAIKFDKILVDAIINAYKNDKFPNAVAMSTSQIRSHILNGNLKSAYTDLSIVFGGAPISKSIFTEEIDASQTITKDKILVGKYFLCNDSKLSSPKPVIILLCDFINKILLVMSIEDGTCDVFWTTYENIFKLNWENPSTTKSKENVLTLYNKTLTVLNSKYIHKIVSNKQNSINKEWAISKWKSLCDDMTIINVDIFECVKYINGSLIWLNELSGKNEDDIEKIIISFDVSAFLGPMAALRFYADEDKTELLYEVQSIKKEKNDLKSIILNRNKVYLEYIPGTTIFYGSEWFLHSKNSFLPCSIAFVPKYFTKLTEETERICNEESSTVISMFIDGILKNCVIDTYPISLQMKIMNHLNSILISNSEKLQMLIEKENDIITKMKLLGIDKVILDSFISTFKEKIEIESKKEKNLISPYIIELSECIINIFSTLNEPYESIIKYLTKQHIMMTSSSKVLSKILRSRSLKHLTIHPEIMSELNTFSSNQQKQILIMTTSLNHKEIFDLVRSCGGVIRSEDDIINVDPHYVVAFIDTFNIDILKQSDKENKKEEEEDALWECSQCHEMNDKDNIMCVFCDAAKKPVIKPKKKEIKADDSSNELLNSNHCINVDVSVQKLKEKITAMNKSIEFVNNDNEIVGQYVTKRFELYNKDYIAQKKENINRYITDKEKNKKIIDIISSASLSLNQLNELAKNGIDFYLDIALPEDEEIVYEDIIKTAKMISHNNFTDPLSLRNSSFISLGKLRYYTSLINKINEQLSQCIPLINPTSKTNNDIISQRDSISLSLLLSSVREIISPKIKNDLLTNIIELSEYDEDLVQIPTFKVDRITAVSSSGNNVDQVGKALMKSISKKGDIFLKNFAPFSFLLGGIMNKKKQSIQSEFLQVFEQAGKIDPACYRSKKIDRDHNAFKIEYQNELVQGLSGPYRQFFSDIANELQSPDAEKDQPQLIIPTENNVNKKGEFKDKFTLNPSCDELSQYEFIGILMGISIRTGVYLSLDLCSLIWKKIVNEKITISDIKQFDEGLYQLIVMKEKELSEEEIQSTFGGLTSISLTDGKKVELKQYDITKKEERVKMIDEIVNIRLNESSKQIESIKKGISKMLPLSILNFFTWNEFACLVCGRKTVDIELLKKNTIISPELKENENLVQWLWEILNEFDDAMRVNFVKFCYAQESLPPNQEEYTKRQVVFTIKFNPQSKKDQLPRADTCFFFLIIPQYSSKEIMKKMITIAISMDNIGMNGDKVNEQSVNSSVHVINDAFGVFRGARSGRTFNYGMNFDYGDEEDY